METYRKQHITQFRVRKADNGKLDRVYSTHTAAAIRAGADGVAVELKVSDAGEVTLIRLNDGTELPARDAMVKLMSGELAADKVLQATVGRRGKVMAGFAKIPGCNSGVLFGGTGNQLARAYS